MCGIAGIHFKHDVSAEALDRVEAVFRQRLAHRGPDHVGVHRTRQGLFMNLRLAIVDRAGGQQPIYAPGGRRGIVYNGEVYNHEALRAPLVGQWPFATASDTEVLLATWVHQGPAAFAAWNGMFGACLFDDDSGQFVLVRDRFGAKPLYIYEDERCIAFASELRALLALPGLDHTPDPVGFQDHLSYRYNLAPFTQFRRIQKLPAGCFATWAPGADGPWTRQTVRYASLSLSEPATVRSETEYVEELDELMTRAVKSQLMGEVPIGVLLSGGLDSSAIAAYVHRAGARLKAYSIGLPEVNEFAFSRAVAQKFGLDYHEVVLTQDDLRRGIERVIGLIDEPIADPACFALARLCEDIRRDVTVVLSGEGGDELFAGYGHHQLALQPGLDRATLFGHFFVQSANDVQSRELLADKELPLQHLRFRALFDGADTPLNGMQAMELATWLPENLMMKADKVLMAHSLEGRFPFLDLDLMRFASTLPQAMKLPSPASSKHVLRRLVTPQLPREVIERRKMGFTVPTAFMLQGMQDRLMAAVDTLQRTPLAGVLDLPAIGRLLQGYYAGTHAAHLRVWNLAVLLRWWTEVYPSVVAPVGAMPATTAAAVPAAVPAPARAVAAPRRKLTVYTVLIGAKEALADPLAHLPADATTDLDIDWVCLTDRPEQPSRTWRLVRFDDPHLPPEKLSRRPKAMPHAYFPDADVSLYVDNTVVFKRLPQAADLVPSPAGRGEPLFRAFRHATRRSPDEEAAAVASIGYDDVATVAAQMAFYARRRALASITPLTTATVLLREHHQPAVRRFGELWWESILAFSKRDQLSFDFARIESGVALDWWPGSTNDNDLLHWHGGVGRPRVQANFDPVRYAWLHRDDPQAVRDPRAHYLQHAPVRAGAAPTQTDPRFARRLPVMEYACWRTESSLGQEVSPRRGMAQGLEDLIGPAARPGLRYLVVRVQGNAEAQAFSPHELDRAAQALSILLRGGQGTVMDLAADEFADDGKVYSTAQAPYGLVVVLGLPGHRLATATRKLGRLLDPAAGRWVLALTSACTLRDAAGVEDELARQWQARVSTALQASRHDDLLEALPNTLVGFSWAAAVDSRPAGASTLEGASAPSSSQPSTPA